jgi:hypothetical protein
MFALTRMTLNDPNEESLLLDLSDIAITDNELDLVLAGKTISIIHDADEFLVCLAD